MIYLYINNHQIKALYLKKSLLGSLEVDFFEKKFQLSINQEGKVVNTDILASAVKEVLNSMTQNARKDKDIVLILPQPAFKFLRTEIPSDLTSSAITSFINDKMNSQFGTDFQNYYYDYFYSEKDHRQQINLYAIDRETVQRYQEGLHLVDLKITNIIPETIGYFNMFDKTLRSEKKENILYGVYSADLFFAYLYDSFGLVDGKKIEFIPKTTALLEKDLKTVATNFEAENKKVNRLILSGEESDNIRQDTFTKNTGMWTNPLKKIANNFYQNYLAIFMVPNGKPFPVLTFDVCLGAYIFLLEDKNFSLTRQMTKVSRMHRMAPATSSPAFPGKTPGKKLVTKEVLIFIASFVVSFAFFVFLSKMNFKFSLPSFPSRIIPEAKKPTATPAPPSPTPTPSFKKEELKVKVLNGSGTAGKAGQVKDILKKDGYGEILTGNANNFDFKETVVEIKKSKAAIFDGLKKELADYTTTIKQENLNEDASADIIITVGSDFK